MKSTIIIPFRDSFKNGERHQQLDIVSKRIQEVCKEHSQDYEILVIHQNGDDFFNKSMLLNIGVDISIKNSDYFILHDVDHYPLNVNNLYREREKSGNLLKIQDGKEYTGPGFWGGVVYIKKEDYLKINGFCNYFWGWGWEDSAIGQRLNAKDIEHEQGDGIFKQLYHKTNHRYYKNSEFGGKIGNPNYINNGVVYHLYNNVLDDGYNNLSYTITDTKKLGDKIVIYNVTIPPPQYDTNVFLTDENIDKLIGPHDLNVLKDLMKTYYHK